ncbi:MAG: hypothetical protein OEW19_11610 [Acidobacteriota bacterium]|nr:hypothetical protein [Acidobacteriota bacterium]
MAKRGWKRARPGVTLAALCIGLTLTLGAQNPSFVITDLAGQQAPQDPLPASWTLNPNFALEPFGIFRRADGRLHVTARNNNLYLEPPRRTSSARRSPRAGRRLPRCP